MTTYVSPSTAAERIPHATPSVARRAARRTAQWANRLILAIAIWQFYAAGLAIFAAAGMQGHAIGGWLVQLLSLLTTLLLFAARVPFATSRWALLNFLLAVLQPVLAFGVRTSLPAVAALHPVNGVAILAVALVLERQLRSIG